jgi:hypothetical protein
MADDEDWEAPDEVGEYKQAPTLANAIRLLTVLRIPVIAAANVAGPEYESPPVKRSRRGGNFDEISFAYVDLLHDIYDSVALSPGMVTWILNGTMLPAAAKTRIYKLCTTSAITITPALAKEFAQLPPPFLLQGKSNKFTVDERNSFYQYVVTLATTYKDKEMPVVLDGIHNAFHKQVVEVDAARSLALCAFVQVLFSHVTPVIFTRNTPSSMELRMSVKIHTPITVSSICFLTGEFQTLDLPLYNTFIKRLTSELSHTVPWVVNAVTFRHQPSQYKGLSRTSLTLASGVVVPLRGNIFKGFTTSFKTKLAIVQDLRNRFCLSYTKKELRVLLSHLSDLTEAQQPAFSEFIETIANANLFRDAFKAQVAIDNNAVFITNDRLCQVYHYKQHRSTKVASLLFTYKPDLIICGVAA